MQIFNLTQEQLLQIGISVIVIVATATIGRWLIRIILARVATFLTGQTENTLDDAILEVVRVPSTWLALIFALQFGVARVSFLFTRWQGSIDTFFFIIYLVFAFVIVLRIVAEFFDWYGREISIKTETELDDQLLPFFRRMAVIIIATIFIIAVLKYFAVDVSGLVATLGIGSLAIALAAKETLSDTISGFVIMIDRPYRIGDRIELLDLDTWGDVIDLGLRSTRILTRDNRMVIIPNSLIAKSLIVNHEFPNAEYRLQIHVGVAYGSDIELARNAIINSVRDVKGVLSNKPVEALFIEFGDSAIIFRVRWWLDSYFETRRMFDSVNTAIYHGLNNAGVVIPFPQRDVHHKFGNDGNAERIEVNIETER